MTNTLKALFLARWRDKCDKPCDDKSRCSCFDWAEEHYKFQRWEIEHVHVEWREDLISLMNEEDNDQ